MTYTPESGKWITTYGGVGHESFGREYTFNGEFDPNAGCYPSSYSGCITCEDMESYHTDRVLTYTKASTEQNASTRTILNGPTSNPNSGCYGGFSTPGTWNSYGWTITGTGSGEISQSSWTVHNNPKIWSGTRFGTSMTGSESNQSENNWTYTILFTEEKSASGNWKYTNADCDGLGYFWSEKSIESTDNPYSRSVKQGLATLNGDKDYTESLTEFNWYDIDCTVNTSGQIVFNLSGYGSQTQATDHSYSGSTDETTFTNGTVSLNESGGVHMSQERLVDWTYDASGFDADVTTTKETHGNHSFTYDYNYSSSCNGYANTFNQDWSENCSWNNEKVFSHTFSNTTWNTLWANRFTSYEQTGCGCGSGSRSTNSWSSGCGCGCANSKEDAYGYAGNWSESYDSATSEYSLTGGIDNQVSGTTSYSGCENSYDLQTHTTRFYNGAYTTDSEFSYINPLTTGALSGTLYMDNSTPSGYGGSGCNGLYGHETSIPSGQISDTSCASTQGRVPGMSPVHIRSSVYSSNTYTGPFYALSSVIPPSTIRMETRSGNYRDPTAISSTAAQNSIFSEWKLWRDESRMNAELDEVIAMLAELQNPSMPSARAAKLHEPGLVVLDLYNTDGDTIGQNVSINVSSYLPASGNYQLRVAEDETFVDAALSSGILTLSVPENSTQAGMTVVTVVGQDANGFLVSWTVTVHVVAVTGYEVEEQSWNETSWGSKPEDSEVNSAEENWSVLWRENDYRWQAKTTADGLIRSTTWTAANTASLNYQTYASTTQDSSRDRWAYGTPLGNGEQLISPTVTFGGASIYHPNVLNTVSVGMKRETELDETGTEQRVYTADQRRIAVTAISSIDWVTVASPTVTEDGAKLAKLELYWDVNDEVYKKRTFPEKNSPNGVTYNVVEVEVTLAAAIPEGMMGTLHLDWYDPNNVLANSSTTTNCGRGTRDNDADVVLNAAGNGLPGWTLTFAPTDSDNECDAVQKSYLTIADARYADNFIVAAHPNADAVCLYAFQNNVLKYQDRTGLLVCTSEQYR